MATTNNLINGIHHVSLKCTKAEYGKVIDFYTNVLGLKILKVFGSEEIPDGVMIDANNACIEIFTNKTEEAKTGIIRHLAFNVSDVDSLIERIRSAGYEIFKEPKDAVLASVPPTNIRFAFCYGPLGEQIEFFNEK